MSKSKLIIVVETIYKYILVSFYFWINLLKGFVIYSLIPACCALVLTISDLQNLLDNDIKTTYKAYYEKYRKYKFQSFLFIFIIILCYFSLFFLNEYNNSIATIITIVIIYVGLMTIILFTYCVHFLTFQKMDFKQSILISFVTSIKKLFISVSIFGFFLLLYLIAKGNFFLFIVVAPVGYGLMSIYVIKRAIG